MSRIVNLVSYLPKYLQEYKEIIQTLEAENPEFILLWSGADRTLRNLFIETADDYGLSRFEALLNIIPEQNQTLEERREIVRFKWWLQIPYTWKFLLYKLNEMCGPDNYIIWNNFETGYTLYIKTFLDGYGKVDKLTEFLDEILPMNIAWESYNVIECNATADVHFGGRPTTHAYIILTQDFNETYSATAQTRAAGAAGWVEFMEITSD